MSKVYICSDNVWRIFVRSVSRLVLHGFEIRFRGRVAREEVVLCVCFKTVCRGSAKRVNATKRFRGDFAEAPRVLHVAPIRVYDGVRGKE